MKKTAKTLPATDGIGRLSSAELEIAELKRRLAECEAALKSPEVSQRAAEMEAIFAAQDDIILLYDTEMNVRRANPSFVTTYGFNPVGLNLEEIVRRVSGRRLDGEPIIWEDQPTPRALRGEKAPKGFFKAIRADGTQEIVETTSGPMKLEGNLTGAVTVWHDITRLQQIERSLSESEERYRLLYDNSIDGILITTPDGDILAANAAACRIFGRSEEEICRRGRYGVMDRSDPRVMKAVEERARTGRFYTEMTLIRGDGSCFTGEVSSTVFRSQDGRLMTSMIVRDITDRKQAEDALRGNEHRLQQTQDLLEAVTQGTEVIIAAVDTNFCYTLFNKAYQEEVKRISGKDIHIGASMLETFAHMPEQQQIVLTEWKQVLAGETTNKMLEFGDSGRYQKTYNILHTPIRDAGGKIVGAGEVARDVTEIVRTEEMLRESEARFRLILKNAPVTVAAQDKELRFIWAFNQRTINPTDVIGKTDADVFPPEYATRLMALKRQVLDTGTEIRDQFWMTSGGNRVFLDLFFEPMRDKAGQITGVGIATVDLTGRKLAEAALQQAYDEMEERVKERTQELLHSNEQLQREIDERKRVEAHLRVQTSALEAAANGIIITGKGGNILWANPAFTQMAGYSLEEIFEKTPRFLKSGHHDQSFYQSLWGTILSGQVWHGEMVNRRKDGSQYIEEQTITPVFDEKGGITNFIAIKQDITNRRKAEQALEKSEERYRSLVVATAQIVWSTNADGDVVEDIPTWRAFTGQAVQEIQGQGWILALHPDDRQRVVDIWAHSVETHTLYDTEYRLRRHDGKYRHFAVRGVPVLGEGHNIREWIGTGHDITEHIQADEKLKQASAYHRSLIEVSLDPLVTITQDGKIGDVNTSTEAVTGFSRAELIGTDFHNYFTEPERARSGYQHVFEKGSVRDYELEIQHKDGRVTPVLYNASVYRDETGGVIGVFAAARDITERKRAEARLEEKNRESLALSQAERSLRLFAESLAQATLMVNSSLDLNTVFDHILEQIHLVIPFRTADIVLLEGEALHVARHRGIEEMTAPHEIMQTSFPLKTFPVVEKVLRSRQAVWVADTRLEPTPIDIPELAWVHSYITAPLQTSDVVIGFLILHSEQPNSFDQDAADHLTAFAGQATMAIQNARLYNDLEIALAQEQAVRQQLIQTEKFTAMGRMLASITHELNNPLQTIKNCLFLTQNDLPPDSPMIEFLNMASSETERLSDLVAQLREVYRPQQAGQVKPIQILNLLTEVHNLLGTHLRDRHVQWMQVSSDLADSSNQWVNGIADQIKQVFLNISMNAVEAMPPEGGRLMVDLIPSKNGREVGVKFQDTGPGIPTEEMSRLFEPFYTTKTKGLGLGLSICYDIVQRHGGNITVESQLGQGTVFTIWLPLINPEQLDT